MFRPMISMAMKPRSAKQCPATEIDRTDLRIAELAEPVGLDPGSCTERGSDDRPECGVPVIGRPMDLRARKEVDSSQHAISRLARPRSAARATSSTIPAIRASRTDR
jgi:hypothetical protein